MPRLLLGALRRQQLVDRHLTQKRVIPRVLSVFIAHLRQFIASPSLFRPSFPKAICFSPPLEPQAKLNQVAYTRKQHLLLTLVPPLSRPPHPPPRLLPSATGTSRLPGAPLGHTLPGPVVYAFWHRCLLTCAYRFRNLDIAILISPSFDGELIARTVERLGFRPIRGSSSRGGTLGLRNMERAFREGYRCAITADGPRGPAMIAKPGTAQLAGLVQAPIGTFYAIPDRAWQIRSWDRFLIPKPFSTVTFTWPPIVPADEPAVQTALQRKPSTKPSP